MDRTVDNLDIFGSSLFARTEEDTISDPLIFTDPRFPARAEEECLVIGLLFPHELLSEKRRCGLLKKKVPDWKNSSAVPVSAADIIIQQLVSDSECRQEFQSPE
jgi:hypothetical protein